MNSLLKFLSFSAPGLSQLMLGPSSQLTVDEAGSEYLNLLTKNLALYSSLSWISASLASEKLFQSVDRSKLIITDLDNLGLNTCKSANTTCITKYSTTNLINFVAGIYLLELQSQTASVCLQNYRNKLGQALPTSYLESFLNIFPENLKATTDAITPLVPMSIYPAILEKIMELSDWKSLETKQVSRSQLEKLRDENESRTGS